MQLKDDQIKCIIYTLKRIESIMLLSGQFETINIFKYKLGTAVKVKIHLHKIQNTTLVKVFTQTGK